MATWNTDIYTAKQSTNNSHGFARSSVHLHATSGTLPTSLATNDVINVGYLPTNAVVVSVILKAQSQLDSSTGLVLSLGVSGTAGLWMSGVTTVGRAAGVTSAAWSPTTNSGTAGALYKTAAKTLVICTVTTQATTAVAGVLEFDLEYYIEDAAGSAP